MDTIQVVAEPRRRAILRLIWDGELPVSAIAAEFPISTAAVSQHLSRLHAAGAVTVRAEGKQRLYRADRDALALLAPALEMMWRDDLARLADEAERAHAAARRGGKRSSRRRSR